MKDRLVDRETARTLLDQAIQARRHAYAPYSNLSLIHI